MLLDSWAGHQAIPDELDPMIFCLQLSMHKERYYSLDQKDRYIFQRQLIAKISVPELQINGSKGKKNESEMKPLLTFKGCDLLVLLLNADIGPNNHKQQAAAALLHLHSVVRREILFALLWSQNHKPGNILSSYLPYFLIIWDLKSLLQNSATWRDMLQKYK